MKRSDPPALDDLTMMAQVGRYGRSVLVCTVQGATLCLGHWMVDAGLTPMGPGHELSDLQRTLAFLRRDTPAYYIPMDNAPHRLTPMKMIGAIERATGHSYRGCRTCDRDAMHRLSRVPKGRERVEDPPERREVDWGEGWRHKPLRYR